MEEYLHYSNVKGSGVIITFYSLYICFSPSFTVCNIKWYKLYEDSSISSKGQEKNSHCRGKKLNFCSSHHCHYSESIIHNNENSRLGCSFGLKRYSIVQWSRSRRIILRLVELINLLILTRITIRLQIFI